MSALKYINRLKRIDRLVRLKATGSPKQLACTLGISERSLYQYLGELKALGAPVAWSMHENSYIYVEEGMLDIEFRRTENYVGGFNLTYPSPIHSITTFSEKLTQPQACCSMGEYL
jgi:hypothetical protein